MSWRRLALPVTAATAAYAALLWLLSTPATAARAQAQHGLPAPTPQWLSTWFHTTPTPGTLPYNLLAGPSPDRTTLHEAEYLRYALAVALLLLAFTFIARTVPPTRKRWFSNLLAAWGLSLLTAETAIAVSAPLLAHAGRSGQTPMAIADQLAAGSPAAAAFGLAAALVLTLLGSLFGLGSGTAPAPEAGYRRHQARWIAWIGAFTALAYLAAANQATERRLPGNSWTPVLQHLLYPGTWTWHLAGSSWRDWAAPAFWLLLQPLLIGALLRRLTTRQCRRGAWRVLLLALPATAIAALVTAVLTALLQGAHTRDLLAATGSTVPATAVLAVVTGLLAALTARAVRGPAQDPDSPDAPEASEASDASDDLDSTLTQTAPPTAPFDPAAGFPPAPEPSETVRFARPPLPNSANPPAPSHRKPPRHR